MSDVLLVECPCGVPFAVRSKWIRDHPQGIYQHDALLGPDGNYTRCGRKYSVVTLEKEFWRGTWKVEEDKYGFQA
jgi:hypothetical protein